MKTKSTFVGAITGGTMVFFLAAMIFSAVVILTGCENTPLTTESIDSQDQISFFDLPYDPEAMAKRADDVFTIDTIAFYENFITVTDGGVVLLGETESADAFVVQPESFPYDTSFVLEVTKIVSVDGPMAIIYDCGPDGLTFSKPAILLINAWADFGKPTTSVNLYWLNETTNKWEFQAEAQVDDAGRAAFELDHFSKWGTEDGGPTTDREPKGRPLLP